MKPKKIKKKLSLNKNIVAELNDLSMGTVKAGADAAKTYFTRCATFCYTVCGWTCDSCDPTFDPNGPCVCS